MCDIEACSVYLTYEGKCEYCGVQDIPMHLEDFKVDRAEIKLWHYDCRIQDKLRQDDLAVRVFKDKNTLYSYVISYMTQNAVKFIDKCYPDVDFEILSDIIRVPLAELGKK